MGQNPKSLYKREDIFPKEFNLKIICKMQYLGGLIKITYVKSLMWYWHIISPKQRVAIKGACREVVT